MKMKAVMNCHTYGTLYYAPRPNQPGAPRQLRWRAPASLDPDPRYGGEGQGQGGKPLIQLAVQQSIPSGSVANINKKLRRHLLKKCCDVHTKAFKVK